MKSWKPEVQVNGDDIWAGNALRFATEAEAQKSVKDLEMRWLLVTATRVTESDDPVNYKWVDGEGLQAV
jgi:hypothetical protein